MWPSRCSRRIVLPRGRENDIDAFARDRFNRLSSRGIRKAKAMSTSLCLCHEKGWIDPFHLRPHLHHLAGTRFALEGWRRICTGSFTLGRSSRAGARRR